MSTDPPRAGMGERIDALGPDHVEIFELLIAKAERGSDAYGLLHVSGDPRDFEAEARDELLDAVHYLGAAIVRLKRECDGLRVLVREQAREIERLATR